MPAVSERERMMHLREMARKHWDMLTGIYQWPDGRVPKFDKETGYYEWRKGHLLELAGYDPTYTRAFDYFNPATEYGKLYQGVFLMEKARREANLAAEPIRRTMDGLQLILDLSQQELLLRLQQDPGQFTNSDLDKVVKNIEPRVRALYAAGSYQAPTTTASAFQSTLKNLPKSERKLLAGVVLAELEDETDGPGYRPPDAPAPVEQPEPPSWLDQQ